MTRTGPRASDIVARNVRVLREVRGYTVRQLSARMTEVGHPILPSGITKIEHVNPALRRRVTVDDLDGLAAALDFPVGILLDDLPAEPSRLLAALGLDPIEVFRRTWKVRGTADVLAG